MNKGKDDVLKLANNMNAIAAIDDVTRVTICEESNANEVVAATTREAQSNPSFESKNGSLGIQIGKLTGITDKGEPMVDFDMNSKLEPLPARSIVPLNLSHIGSEVALSFVSNILDKPIVLGLLQDRRRDAGAITVESDEETLSIKANKEIVLKCGRASITLTRAGKILLRGAYLLSRSSGVNRIKGGSVQIN